MADATIVLVVRVTADEAALRAHTGSDIDIHETLYNHVVVPITEPCFDTPARLEVVAVLPEER